MSTIEKLTVQIFERKNSIIEQVRHQVKLYDQQLASKLVIQGIDPPAWLWNHEAAAHSSDPSEIDKQRLISELLLPLPQQPVPYFNNFNYNSLGISECKFDQHDERMYTTHFEDVRFVPDFSKEVEHAASSPQQQVATRLDDGNSGLDFSRTEFKRSKSRQRALEQRSSAKSGTKRHAKDENVSVVSFRNGTPSMDEFLRSNDVEKPDSAKYLNIQFDHNSLEGINASCCTENKVTEGYESICFSTDQACSKTKIGSVFSDKVNRPVDSEDHMNMPQEGNAESAGIEIESCNNNTSEESPNQRIDHVCGSVDHVFDTKYVGDVFRGQINEPTQLQETSSIQFVDTEFKSRDTVCSEGNVSESIPSRSLNHGSATTERDIRYTSKTSGVITCGQVDENSTDEVLSDVAHGNCSPNAVPDVNYLRTTGEVFLPSRISSSEISSKELLDVVSASNDANKDNEVGSVFSYYSLQDHQCEVESADLITPSIFNDCNSGMVKEKTDGNSSSDKRLKTLSANSVKTKTSLRKNSELIPNFPAVENDGGIRGVSLSCNTSQSDEYIIQTLQSASPAVIIASPKSSELKSSELHTSNCNLEDGNCFLEELKELKTEVEVPQLQSEKGQQLDLLKENTNLMACDHPLLNGVMQDQEKIYRDFSVSCDGTSRASEVSYPTQEGEEKFEEKEKLKIEATSSLLSTISSFSVETESLRFSSHEAKQATDDSLMLEKTSECFLEDSYLSMDVKKHLIKKRSESETFSIESVLKMESSIAGLKGDSFVDSKYDGVMDADQSMPILEGFVMDTDDGESPFAGGQIDIEESSLPGSSLKRASFLERLCQSSSRNTPISQFPMTYGLHKTSDLFQSVPNGLLEHVSQVGNCSNMKLQQKSHSAGLPVSTSFNVSTPYASPFKKKWDHSTSSSGLRSQGSLNPELVCFTIEEDPANCDEIVNNDEAAEAPPSSGSCLKSSSKRKPLTDITEDVNNLYPSVSVNGIDGLEAGLTPKFRFRSQLDSTGTEAYITGAQTRAKQKLGKKFSYKKSRLNDAKEKRNVSVGANGGRQFTESQKVTKSQKFKYSENQKKTTGVSDLPKVLRSNNIVSSISSFIPLVQQNKAAAVNTGKRDVKVKALEAAEAAKCLAEKKENERKAKKEAWKAEKARMEQENLLQLELKKKKKEEELKKKEAEMAARKRIREEEDKKVKEGKRRRIEEAHKQQLEQEKKQADKLTRHQADGLRIHGKVPNNGMEQCTKMETGGRKCTVTTEIEDKSTTVPCVTKTMSCDLKRDNILMKADNGDSNITMVVSDFKATAEKNPKAKAEVLQSYDISPYQGSDDEDEDDEDERRKEKFVPAWASKNSLAEAIFAQQHINPDDILPPESFCSIAEVLIPRKLPVR